MIKNDNRWVALFSQTGSEIVELSTRLGRWPNKIITNSKDYANIHPKLKQRDLIIINDTQARTLNVLHNYAKYQDLITLHGWLRIVPADKCKQYILVNGHPGLITRYPELKGYNPQVRYWDNKDKYEYYGSVVHEVTAEVDEGKVITVSEKKSTDGGDNPYDLFKETSFEAWLDFLKGQSIINV